jgi:8-oxo-dGTP pyrophosphatase MutT (NUDIX family)
MKIRFRGLRPLVRRRTADIVQAGAIVINDRSGKRKLLVVTNKGGRRWLFPKGSVKKKENPEEAALREAAEEAGVKGEVLAYIGATEDIVDGDEVRVDYFLVRCDRMAKPDDDREIRWCTPQKCLDLLSDPVLKKLLDRALPEIMKFK